MELKFLTRESISEMKTDSKRFIPMLTSENRQDIQLYLNNNNCIKNVGISVEDFNLEKIEDVDISDLNNIMLLYSKMKDLPMRIAADERLWAWLTIEKFWDYVYYRRKNDWENSKDNRAYYQSFFYTYGPSRSQVLNTISRLWWAGYYTYDATRKGNEYKLTKFYFKKAFSSNILLLQSSKCTANKEIRLGLLDALKDWIEKYGLSLKREYLVAATKYLNIIGGASILDFYSRTDIYNLVFKYLEEKYLQN